MTRRGLSREERALWQATTRSVAPLRQRRPAAASEPPTETAAPTPSAAPHAVPARRSHAALPTLAPGAAPGVDRRTADKQRRGQLPIEARLDLHGFTQEEAHRALVRFVADSESRGLRHLLIITGKGSAGGSAGVLKAAVPRWLNERELRPRVLSFSWAQQRHGGAGALYLLLRRRR